MKHIAKVRPRRVSCLCNCIPCKDTAGVFNLLPVEHKKICVAENLLEFGDAML